MSVVGVARAIADGRIGDDLEDGLKRFTRTYIVETDTPFDGPNIVLNATGLPQHQDPYDGHPTAVVVGRFPHPLPGTRLAWHVEVEWSTHSIDRDENPLNTKPEIEWGYEPYDETLVGAAMVGRGPLEAGDPTPSSDPETGDPIQGGKATSVAKQLHYGVGVTNSAGDPFDPPPTEPSYYPAVRFTRNELNFDAVRAITYGNTVNKNSWNGLLPRQAWLKPIEANNQVQHAAGIDQPDILYWRVRYTFVLKGTTWDRQLLNIGPNYFETDSNGNKTGRKLRFKTADGTPTHDLLKANGTRYRPATATVSAETQIATYSHFRTKRESNFADLAINLSLPLNQIRRPRR